MGTPFRRFFVKQLLYIGDGLLPVMENVDAALPGGKAKPRYTIDPSVPLAVEFDSAPFAQALPDRGVQPCCAYIRDVRSASVCVRACGAPAPLPSSRLGSPRHAPLRAGLASRVCFEPVVVLLHAHRSHFGQYEGKEQSSRPIVRSHEAATLDGLRGWSNHLLEQCDI
jgi:hypothetical protein